MIGDQLKEPIKPRYLVPRERIIDPVSESRLLLVQHRVVAVTFVRCKVGIKLGKRVNSDIQFRPVLIMPAQTSIILPF